MSRNDYVPQMQAAQPQTAPDCILSLVQQVEKQAANLAERLHDTNQFIVGTPDVANDHGPQPDGLVGILLTTQALLSRATGHAGDIARKLGVS